MWNPGTTVWACALAWLWGAACQSGSRQPAAAKLAVQDVSVDALGAPRGDDPLVAGEAVRVGLGVRGGTPPYAATLTAVRIGKPLGPDEVNPLDTDLDPDPASQPSDALDMAFEARLHKAAPSGVYQLKVTITDSRGQTSMGMSRDFTLVGSDALTWPRKVEPPFVEILDAAGRRRRSFVRGERVVIHGRMPGAGQAGIELLGPDGALLARTTQPLSHTGELAFAVDVPRLATAGTHTVRVTSEGTKEALAEPLEVAGLPFPPAHRLVVDDLALYGGKDLRAPRAGLLERGETLLVETRVGGGRRRVSTRVRLATITGKVVADADLGHAEIARPTPGGRVYIQGTWQVPAQLAPGRYQLLIEALEGDDVSARYREVLVE